MNSTQVNVRKKISYALNFFNLSVSSFNIFTSISICVVINQNGGFYGFVGFRVKG